MNFASTKGGRHVGRGVVVVSWWALVDLSVVL